MLPVCGSQPLGRRVQTNPYRILQIHAQDRSKSSSGPGFDERQDVLHISLRVVNPYTLRAISY